MDALLQFSGAEGYWILFGAVLLDVLGFPLTAMPLMFIAGGFAASGSMSFFLVVALTTLASVSGDTLWYGLGRRGRSQLSWLDKLDEKKKRCMIRSIQFVKTHGSAFLLISKFIPGVASVACPAAGLASMPWKRFIVVNLLGRALWAASVSWMGYSGMAASVQILSSGL